jgi:hypothetical protein
MQLNLTWRVWGFDLGEGKYYGWRLWFHIGPLHILIGKIRPF